MSDGGAGRAGVAPQPKSQDMGPWSADRLRELIVVPLSEAGLLLIAAGAAWLLHQPLFFASLGPTTYELTETPERASARPYNIVVGHLVGVCAGLFAVWATHARYAPPITAHSLAGVRFAAAALAAFLTVLVTMLLHATQPAALSTTLLVTTGLMQTPWDGLMIMASIALITAFGEPLRRWRMAHRQQTTELIRKL